MPWHPLPRIAFAVATFPFTAERPADLPLEIGDELYIIEETADGNWLRGYLVAPPSLLAGLTSVQGQTLEARVFSGIFPRSCVEIREMLGESEDGDHESNRDDQDAQPHHNDPRQDENASEDSAKGGLESDVENTDKQFKTRSTRKRRAPLQELPYGTNSKLSVHVKRDPRMPRPPAPVPMLKIGDETPTSASEPLIDEISSCLREWHSKNLHQLLLSREYAKLDKLSQLITKLNLHRQQFLYNVLTAREYETLREKTVWDLVQVNKLCGGEVIVRDPGARGRILTGEDSAVALTELQSTMSVLDEPPKPTIELASLHHLLLDIKGFAGTSTEETCLVAYLASKPHHDKPINLSEAFSIDVPAGRTMGSLMQDGATRTLFTDLSSVDIGDVSAPESDLYLVVKVLSPQRIEMTSPQTRSGSVGDNYYTREHTKSLPVGGGKGSRRSFMWAAKSTRSTFSRGSAVNKMDAVNEHQGDRPYSNRTASRDDHGPPSTAGSQASMATDEAQTAQRTVGVGVMKLNAIMKQDEDIEHVISIWAPSKRPMTDKEMGEEWNPLIREIMGNSSESFERARRGERLQVSLKAFDHPDPDALIKATPTILSGVSKTSRIGFSGAPTRPRSDIYLTVNAAALAKQNLLSRYGGSATGMSPGMQASNLQVTLEVRHRSGKKIENCIFPSSNSNGLTTFKSVATERGEAWNQTLRLSLPSDDVASAHVVMFVSDMPSPPFAVAHIPLWDREAFIRDGPHGLLLYKIDEHTSTAQAGPTGKGGYLSTVWAPRGRDERSVEVTGPLALLLIETFLCSTRFSQDRVILGLLKWKDLAQEDLAAVLRQINFVPEIEIVKLLGDVLDGLFGILVEHSGNNEYEDLVFTALVRVLGIVHDRRFNLVPLVDQYAEMQFNYPFAASCLVRALTRLLQHPTETETARKLRSTFKIVRHILKFITQARSQQRAKEAGIGIKTSAQGFTKQLKSIFKALEEMMRNPAPVLVGSQTLVVQHFHTWLPELTDMLTAEDILHIAIDFMDSCTDVKGKLTLYKLVLIINYSKLDIFSHPDQRSALSANTVRWISPHWGHCPDMTDQWKNQIRLCCSILANQLDYIGPEIPDHAPRAIDSYLSILASPPPARKKLSLLFPSSYPFPTKTTVHIVEFDEALAELSAILSAISSSPVGMQLELADSNIQTMLENVLQVQISILKGEAFPEGWLSVHIYHHKSAMRTLQYLATILLESFLPHPDDAETFNTDLWRLFFETLLQLVGSPSLALETFPEQKRRAVWKIAGDVREDGAALLRRTWEAIGWDASNEERTRYGLAKMGGYQVQYVPGLVGPIVELCLSVHEGLRRMAVEVLQTMIVSEWTLSEDLSVIQTEMVDCLDIYFKTKPLTESVLQKLFLGELMERFVALSGDTDEPLTEALQDLTATLDEFLDLLVAVHSGDNGSGASDIINRLRLMEFLRDMQKEEIFVRYVHQLASLQAESRNHAEAGLALRLHAELYEWDPNRETGAMADPEYPAQTHFERKERIYFDMIKHFEEGESWSNALTAYKELQAQYETNIYDFAKLARAERAIASIYETISKSDRLVPKYFKVIYRGLGFATTLRDKQYIYEGPPGERAAAFTDRMQEQYPSAKIITAEDGDEVEGQFLVISVVTPHRDLTHPIYQRTRIPQVIRDFLLSSHPQVFSITAKRSTSGPVHEHYSQKLLFTSAEPFPTILRRSEIIDVNELELSAHETALERIVRKTQEMAALERRISEGEEQNMQLLLDAVAVSVNPNSDQSVSCYRKLLPEPKSDNEDEEDDEEDEEEEELSPSNGAIKTALIDHAMMLKKCLSLFGRTKSDPFAANRYDELARHFENTFAPEILTFAPPPPVKELISTPSTIFRGTSPSIEQSPRWQTVISPNGGAKLEEASVVRRVSLQQPRGTRLSFLGGKKSSIDPQPDLNGISESPRSHVHRRSLSKENGMRQAIFRSQSSEATNGERRGSSTSTDRRQSQDDNDTPAKESGLMKRGNSVRKRFSLLKLGIKNKNSAVMGSVDEE
ncbi:SH3 and Ded-cyto domain protein, putative [Cordyceps militaris CM01]|uniref:SH3 and Ded-cyto domain protein, putative n=1 Tax=Cordyceps militaris (strain CM01) TaxID=983644 RepID=G3J2Z9_CORMM|nr:SH3 and Ded-cyto domain protein, putative [Cordyceps militaris CM01]EGX95582.1 SH3 and Ded-cyto domain protein, putative [Cordyceps militaris CM01]